eukprot:TRINITY_DN2999_c1_g1_i3.p4 TRINITY_DN2999_c1_g1~~TRINITY_DN2999_c1_g1_i3.p4  ORF type:complete len:222 (-),score=-7.35 TRINITY_DN2999_c1_g1_i3:1522-2187(-)
MQITMQLQENNKIKQHSEVANSQYKICIFKLSISRICIKSHEILLNLATPDKNIYNNQKNPQVFELGTRQKKSSVLIVCKNFVLNRGCMDYKNMQLCIQKPNSCFTKTSCKPKKWLPSQIYLPLHTPITTHIKMPNTHKLMKSQTTFYQKHKKILFHNNILLKNKYNRQQKASLFLKIMFFTNKNNEYPTQKQISTTYSSTKNNSYITVILFQHVYSQCNL